VLQSVSMLHHRYLFYVSNTLHV